MRSLLLLFILLFFYSCSKNDDTAVITEQPLKAEVLLDVSYGVDPMQTFDLYLPANRSLSTTKILILVHGGGWTSGDKKDMNGFVQLIQNRKKDYAIANINYVLADSSRKAYPNQINDIKAVVAQLKSKASSYKIKPEFGFVGVSAGGHLSLLYAYAFDLNKEVKMVCSVVGPTDFTDPAYLENPVYEDAAPFLIEGFSPENIEILEEISPRHQVTPSSPPTLLFYGNIDPLIPNTQHQFLKVALENANVLNELTVYDGGHGDWDALSYIDLDAKLNVFLDTNL